MARSDEARLTALRSKMDALRAQAQALEARQRGRESKGQCRGLQCPDDRSWKSDGE